jgi:nuclear pore complex protein Nup205
MAEFTTLDALQAFHREIIALQDGHGDGNIDNELLVQNFEGELDRVWERPKRNEASRNALKGGKW